MRHQILSFQSWLVDNILTGQRLDASFFYVMKQGVTYTVIPNSIKLIIIYNKKIIESVSSYTEILLKRIILSRKLV